MDYLSALYSARFRNDVALLDLANIGLPDLFAPCLVSIIETNISTAIDRVL